MTVDTMVAVDIIEANKEPAHATTSQCGTYCTVGRRSKNAATIGKTAPQKGRLFRGNYGLKYFL